jgi:HPt (histidine-containing phosphotransfer) domain-containing protein
MAILSADYSNLNHEEMAKTIGLKSKYVPMLLASFMEESTPMLRELKSDIDSNDFTKIASHAHSIKGSAGNLRLNEVYEMAKEMELSAKASDATFEYQIHLNAIAMAIKTIPN